MVLMKNKIIYIISIIVILGSIGSISCFYYLRNTIINKPRIAAVKTTDNKIEGGTWSTTCTGSADSIHDGNIATGVTCSNGQEINWDFEGTYTDIFRVKIYSSDANGSNSWYNQCWYPVGGGFFNCGGLGYVDWTLIASAFLGPLDPGWNNEDITPSNHSKLKLIFAPDLIPNFRIEEVEVYYTGDAPTPSPTPTPTPALSPTPGGGDPLARLPAGRGREVFLQWCLACHGLDLSLSALSSGRTVEGWLTYMKRHPGGNLLDVGMSEEDMNTLAEYLVAP